MPLITLSFKKYALKLIPKCAVGVGLYSSFYGVYIYNYFFELPTGMCFLSARRLHQPSEQVKIAPRPPKKKKTKTKASMCA